MVRLAPQFKASKIEFADLNALTPGQFFCLSRHGVEKIRMPMAAALKAVAPKAKPVTKALPATFNEWSRAMSQIPTEPCHHIDVITARQHQFPGRSLNIRPEVAIIVAVLRNHVRKRETLELRTGVGFVTGRRHVPTVPPRMSIVVERRGHGRW